MMIIKFMLCGLCCGIVVGDGIQQVHPDASYSCPAGPSLRLQCEFPEGSFPIFWSYPGISFIRTDEPGHMIDNSMISHQMSYLNVTDFSYLKELYRCIAILPNGTTHQWTMMTSPTATLELKCHRGGITDDSIQIKWENRYPDCFRFSVLVDGKLVQDNIENRNEHTVTDLHYNTAYNVCVVARDGNNNTNDEWMDCDHIYSSCTVVCIVIPCLIVGFFLLVLVIATVVLVCRCCLRKKGVPEARKNTV